MPREPSTATPPARTPPCRPQTGARDTPNTPPETALAGRLILRSSNARTQHGRPNQHVRAVTGITQHKHARAPAVQGSHPAANPPPKTLTAPAAGNVMKESACACAHKHLCEAGLVRCMLAADVAGRACHARSVVIRCTGLLPRGSVTLAIAMQACCCRRRSRQHKTRGASTHTAQAAKTSTHSCSARATAQLNHRCRARRPPQPPQRQKHTCQCRCC